MKKVQICTILAGLLMLAGCLKPPEYSTTPRIEFKKLVFKDYPDIPSSSEQEKKDELIFTFSFEDGDGDFGLNSDDVGGKFSEIDYIYYKDDKRSYLEDSTYVKALEFNGFSKIDKDIVDSVRNYILTTLNLEVVNNVRTNQDSTVLIFDVLQDTLIEKQSSGFFPVTWDDNQAQPPFFLAKDTANQSNVYNDGPKPPLSCENYFTDAISGKDFYVRRNETVFNLIIRYFKKINGVYQETNPANWNDFVSYKCVEHAKIPIIDPSKMGEAFLGQFDYRYTQIGLKTILALDTFKVQMYVYDRSLNKSNVVESPDYVLSDIIE